MFKLTRSNDDVAYFPDSRFRENINLMGNEMGSRHDFQEFYRFAGSVLAKALFEKVPVSVKLHPAIIKRLIGSPLNL